MSEKWREASDGILELVDEDTGQVIYREKVNEGRSKKRRVTISLTKDKKSKEAQEKNHYIVVNGIRRWVPKGTNPDTLPRIVYPFCRTTCDEILGLIMEGKTVVEIGKMPGFPPARTIYQWRDKYSEFQKDMDTARKVRADHFHDEAIETARQTNPKWAFADRLKVDALKWGSEVGDRERYGKQTKVVGDPLQPIGFLVRTGVPDEDPPAIVVDSKKVTDESNS